MTDLAAHYTGSKGPMVIADMPMRYLRNAHAKLVDGRDPTRTAEIAAMQARIDTEGDEDPVERAPPTAEPANPRAVIGANSPPTDLDVTVAAHKTHFDDLYTETGNWADGAAIETEAQAAQVDRLLDLWREAIDGATKAQDGLTRPLNEEIATIRSGFSGLIGDTTKIKGLGIRARDVLRQVKTAWGNKVRADQAAEAERLRKVASEQAAQAREALSDAIGNLSATETAEELIQSAQATLKAAKQVERAGAGKGYRTEWRVEITDSRDSIRTMWALHPGEFIALTTQLAERDVRTNGHRSLAGFRIWEEKVAK